ncbi:MAG TPA: hypothetical protein VHW70_15320 [Edaphobacter sp.]|nr:hypothetical protein [Edaphobacter sp.]
MEKQWAVKENFMLLRAILIGSTRSPPLLKSMVVFGRARSLDRQRRFLDAQKRLAECKKLMTQDQRDWPFSAGMTPQYRFT